MLPQLFTRSETLLHWLAAPIRYRCRYCSTGYSGQQEYSRVTVDGDFAPIIWEEKESSTIRTFALLERVDRIDKTARRLQLLLPLQPPPFSATSLSPGSPQVTIAVKTRIMMPASKQCSVKGHSWQGASSAPILYPCSSDSRTWLI